VAVIPNAAITLQGDNSVPIVLCMHKFIKRQQHCSLIPVHNLSDINEHYRSERLVCLLQLQPRNKAQTEANLLSH